MQTLYLATHFNPVYWNTACLIVNSGSLEEEDKTKSTKYEKIAKAIGAIRQAGIEISLVDINKSNFGFSPDAENNRILSGLKNLLNVGDDLVNEIIANRPYTSPQDFLNKVNVKRQSMISLIKAGAFDNMMDRRLCMAWYIWQTCDKKQRLTLQNMGALINYNMLPTQTQEQKDAYSVYEFNRYLKACCKSTSEYYRLDARGLNFLLKMGYEDLILKDTENFYWLSVKDWTKRYQDWMNVFRTWIANDKENILKELNGKIFKEEWDKYASGNISAWEMESLCFYYHEHELANVNMSRYGLVNFFDLPEEPIVDKTFKRSGKEIRMFKLFKICGTCIAKNKIKSTVSLLTPTGVVEVKFRKEYFSLFDKQISQIGADGKKHIVEKSWFNRGSMIVVQGIRSEDNFIVKRYASSPGHQLYKIDQVNCDGTISLRNERYQGVAEEDNDE